MFLRFHQNVMLDVLIKLFLYKKKECTWSRQINLEWTLLWCLFYPFMNSRLCFFISQVLHSLFSWNECQILKKCINNRITVASIEKDQIQDPLPFIPKDWKDKSIVCISKFRFYTARTNPTFSFQWKKDILDIKSTLYVCCFH